MRPQFFTKQKEIKKIEPMKKRRGSFRTYLIIATILMAFLAVGLSFYAVSKWFDTHKIVFNQPLKVKVVSPIVIQERKDKVIEKKMVVAYPGEIDTPIKKYICDKFGVYDCKVALAIVQAESGFNEQAFNANTNDSVDLGCWQINFPTHIKTITPSEALDCEKATDWAYLKYKRDGSFNAWVAYTSGSYLARLEE